MRRGTKTIREVDTKTGRYFTYDLDKDPVTGKRKRLYAHTKEELEEKIKKHEQEKKESFNKDKPKSTKLYDCMNFYLKKALEGTRTKKEIGRRVMIINHTVKDSKIDIPIEEITFDEVQTFFTEISRIYFRKNVEELLETMKMTFEMYEKELEFDKIIIGDKPSSGYILTPEEYELFIEYCLFDNCTNCGSNQIIILFCMFTGISYANAKKMTLNDIDFENNTFVAAGRTYQMDKRTSSWLKEQKLLNRLGDDILFININNTSPAFSSIRVTIDHISIRLGLPKCLTGKTVSESFVIWKLENGMNILQVAEYLGITSNRQYSQW